MHWGPSNAEISAIGTINLCFHILILVKIKSMVNTIALMGLMTDISVFDDRH